MRTKQVFLALAVVAVLSLAAPHAQSQVIGGGYAGFGGSGYGGVVSVGAPLVAPVPLVSPVDPYVAPYPSVVVTRGYSGVVSVGAPLVTPAPLVSPVDPYVASYPSVVVTRPIYGPRIFYGPGWGYRSRFYGPRYYRYGYGRRWW